MSCPAILTKETAYNLIQKARKFTKPGSGLIQGQKNYIVPADQFIHTIVYLPELLQQIQISKNANICLLVEARNAQTEQGFRNYYQQVLSRCLQSKPDRMISVMIQYDAKNAANLLKILRFLQQKEWFVFIKANFDPQSLQQYQQSLAQLSQNIFQQPMILLQAISLVMNLPSKLIIKVEESSAILLAVWSRTLPTSLGSLVIKDWIGLGFKTLIFGLYFQKKLKPVWTLQFITQQISNSESLSCECVGIN